MTTTRLNVEPMGTPAEVAAQILDTTRTDADRVDSLRRMVGIADALNAPKSGSVTIFDDTAAGVVREIDRLQRWVADLQSRLYVNCVYCGHRYGPAETTPVSMADILKAHVEQCPEHPMSALKRTADSLSEALRRLAAQATDTCGVMSEFVAMPVRSLSDNFPTTIARLISKIADARAALAKAEGQS